MTFVMKNRVTFYIDAADVNRQTVRFLVF